MSARQANLAAPALPQVNLLPPEIRAARSVGRIKQWLGIAVLVSLLVVAAGFAYGLFEKAQAAKALETAQAETEQLLTEQARYAEVPPVLSALDEAELARILGLSAEVLWADYLGAVSAVIGDDVSIDTVAVERVDVAAPAEPLAAPAVAVMTFVGRAATVPDIPEWIDALNGVPGFTDARLDVAAVLGDDEETYYEITTQVRVTPAALANRYLETDEEES